MKAITEILLIDKHRGITSFDVIRKLRKKLGIKKMGHAGTLDPLATGLLIIGIGRGTKKLSKFLKLPKTYEAEILLGVKTDTGDMEGKVLREVKIKMEEIDIHDIEKASAEMVGVITLPVPAYSAVKRGGEALYKKARRGEKFDPPEKEMDIRAIELLGHRAHGNGIILKIKFVVGSGTYIRSLAEELGRRIEIPAMLYSLRRTQIGEYCIEDAIEI